MAMNEYNYKKQKFRTFVPTYRSMAKSMRKYMFSETLYRNLPECSNASLRFLCKPSESNIDEPINS